jgi:hypothetical protein
MLDARRAELVQQMADVFAQLDDLTRREISVE